MDFYKTQEWKEAFETQVRKSTWDLNMPVGIVEDGKVYLWYKDGRKVFQYEFENYNPCN